MEQAPIFSSDVTLLRPPTLSPDGRLLAVVGQDSAVGIWKVRPHKPLGWFAFASVVIGLLPATWACQRVGRLRRGRCHAVAAVIAGRDQGGRRRVVDQAPIGLGQTGATSRPPRKPVTRPAFQAGPDASPGVPQPG
jgi:hypothetical protein